MADMVIDSNQNPEAERNLCCCPIAIKAKYFPWVFLAIFGLLFFSGFLCLLSGIIVGYLFVWGRLKCITISDSKAQELESNFIFRCFVRHTNFISPSDALGVQEDGSGGGGMMGGIPQFVRRPGGGGGQ